MSKRARKQTEKAAALQEERNRLNTKKAEKFKNKSSKKRSTQTGSSESEDSEPEARPQKRRRQPDPEEIEVDGGHSDDEPEVVDLVNVDDTEGDDCEPYGGAADGCESEPEAEKVSNQSRLLAKETKSSPPM